MNWISADDLDRWAHTRDSEGKLPLLIARLVMASTSSLEKIQFPSGKSVLEPEWDGYILAQSSQEAFLPTGPSVWEVSTNSDVYGKARDDFEKRLDRSKTALPYGFTREETTYVAVSLRKWPKKAPKERRKEAFLEYAKGKGFWKDVRVLDARDLEFWIAGKIAIESWLSNDVLHLPSDVPDHAEKAWSYWSNRCKYAISPEMVLADREDARNKIMAAIAKGQGSTVVRADSPDEAEAFIIASFLALQEADPARLNFLSRGAIVKSESAAKILADRPDDMILILRDRAEDFAGSLSKAGHAVLIPIGNSRGHVAPDVVLKRQSRSSFVQGLEQIKIPKEEAYQMARKCGCSLTVFARLCPSGTPSTPPWTQRDTLQNLIPAVLAGRWDESRTGDTEILANLSQQSYPEYQRCLASFFATDDPPIRRAGTIVSLNAPPDSFILAKPHLTPGHLDRYRQCVVTVFSEIDPRLELPLSERPFAGLRGVGRKHSEWIREGLAETLLLLSALGEEMQNAGIRSGADFAESIIRGLPSLSTNPLLLASLEQQLPLLMEAAPSPFLEALEQILQGPHSIASMFFADSNADSATWGSSPHTHLLWGLETLAWNPDLLPRVCLILAGLDSADPGGRLANRPIASLREILLPWTPGTNASAEMREKVLDLICDRLPDTGWKLCTALLPSQHMISTPTAEPKWHAYGRAAKEAVTLQEMSSQYRSLLQRVTRLAGNAPKRWDPILHALHNYAEEDQLRVIESFRSMAQSLADHAARLELWKLVRDFTGNQLGFETAQWALKDPVLKELTALAEALAPMDPIEKYRPLFVEHYPNLDVPKTDHDAYRSALSARRIQATKDMMTSQGLDAILPLISDSLVPMALAEPLVAFADTPADVADVLSTLITKGVAHSALFSSISGFACDKFGQDWIDYIRQSKDRFPLDVVVSSSLAWPDDENTFNFIDSLGEKAKELYWKTRPAWTQVKDGRIITFMMEHLFKVGRDLDALHLAGLHEKVELQTQTLYELLDRMPAAIARLEERHIDSMTGYYIDEVFKTLRSRPNPNLLEIARREYGLLPLLDMPWQEKNLVLHVVLSKDPSLFVSVVCDVYKPASRNKDEDGPVDDQKRLRAEYGYRLLKSWKIVPGSLTGGGIQEDVLREWVIQARELAAKNDRADITDQEIGRMFAYAPSDPDDQAWPHKAVRVVLDETRSKHIRIGIEVEQHSKRGVWTKAPFEGGKQEREFAQQWRTWEKVVSPQWPFTGSVLRSVAEEWDRCAALEDLSAEQDRIRYEE